MSMRRNLGGEDRLFRLVLAVAVLPLWLVLDGNAGLLGLAGLGPLLAALIGWSPLYAVFGVSSCTVEKDAPLAPAVGEVAPAA
jgi:hypothetical protein